MAKVKVGDRCYLPHREQFAEVAEVDGDIITKVTLPYGTVLEVLNILVIVIQTARQLWPDLKFFWIELFGTKEERRKKRLEKRQERIAAKIFV